jgi:hypothetical protein
VAGLRFCEGGYGDWGCLLSGDGFWVLAGWWGWVFW